MHESSLNKYFGISLSVVLLHAVVTAAISAQDLADLNSTTSGHLHVAVPFARPCFQYARTLGGTFDLTQCATVMRDYTNDDARLPNFGAYMNTQWETCQASSAQCLLDWNNTANLLATNPPHALCSQGSIPDYYIDVHGPDDVRAALNFSKSAGVPLVVKNTGHDYKGHSSAPGSLALWTHNLLNISFKPDFIAEGCANNTPINAVTYGAGVTHEMLYHFADSMNITLPGGACPTVGAAGGYLQGGGHSPFSNAFGLAVDRVLEFRVVTPTGDYISASACQNTDMFFALRGGGGGTFGVVLEVTLKALPQISFPAVSVSYNGSTTNRRAFLNFMISNSLFYAKQGWGGKILPSGITYVNPLITESDAAIAMAPMQKFVTETLGGTFNLSMQPSYLSYFNSVPTTVPVGRPFITASRLIPAENFETAESQEELLDTLITVIEDSEAPLIFAVAPFFFEDDGMTSVNPVWRRSLWHVTASSFWNFDTTIEQRRVIYENSTLTMNLLRDITPDAGAYQNEADVHEPDFESSFWGTNYQRLAQIKQKYDPDHLLDCWQCVGWQGPHAQRYACYV